MLSPFSLRVNIYFTHCSQKLKVCLHITLFKSKIEIEPAIMILQVEMLFSNFICMDHFSHPQAPPSKYNLPHTGRITSPLSRHWPITITTSPHICKTITVSAFTNSTTRVRIFNHCSKSSHSILCIVTCNGRKDWSIFPFFGPVSCLYLQLVQSAILIRKGYFSRYLINSSDLEYLEKRGLPR